MTVKELNNAKAFAYAIGTKTEGEYKDVLAWIFRRKNLAAECGYGKLWEVVVAFILGVFAKSMKERNVTFWVLFDADLDRRQIDLQVNHVSFQLKFGWSDINLEAKKEELLKRLIFLINTPFPEPCDPGDVFVEILKTAGFSDEEVDREVDENPGFDAVYECFQWFTEGLV